MTIISMSAPVVLPARSRPGGLTASWLWAWVASTVMLIALGTVIGKSPLAIGADTDDAFRFLQLRDLLEGQGWWDVTQSRLGREGTALHWSRLADMPFLIVAAPLALFIEPDMAIRVSGSIVPFLLWGGVVWAVARSVGSLLGRAVLPVIAFAIAMSLHSLAFGTRFGFGSFDHHHVQAVCLALALAGTLSVPTRAIGALAAAAVAASALVGLETAPILIYVCGFWALAWMFRPIQRRDATFAFGLMLMASCVVGGRLFAADYALGTQMCDAFGLGVGGALSMGGFGLATLSVCVSGKHIIARGMACALVAAMVGTFVMIASPQCLANPMDVMSVDVRTLWLDKVQEARGLFDGAVSPSMRAYLIGVPMTALAMAVFAARKFDDERRVHALFLAGWLAVTIGLSAYQIRFHALGLVPAAVVLGAALVLALEWKTEPIRRLTATLAVAFASVGIFHSGLVTAFAADATDTDAESNSVKGLCAEEEVLEALHTLPTGMFFAHFNYADEILVSSEHSALASNYHRGWRDIATHFEVERLSAAEAAPGLREFGIDYVLVCDRPNGDVHRILGGESFLDDLANGVPELIELDLGLPEGVAVYAIR